MQSLGVCFDFFNIFLKEKRVLLPWRNLADEKRKELE